MTIKKVITQIWSFLKVVLFLLFGRLVIHVADWNEDDFYHAKNEADHTHYVHVAKENSFFLQTYTWGNFSVTEWIGYKKRHFLCLDCQYQNSNKVS